VERLKRKRVLMIGTESVTRRRSRKEMDKSTAFNNGSHKIFESSRSTQ
jgi:hypothetical protein